MAPLALEKFLGRLRPTDVAVGRLHYFPTISSTQDEAIRLAQAGAPEGTVVVAGHQTKGRGRLGRVWFSPPGVGLYASVILRPAAPLKRWPTLSVLAGVAVVEELERLGVAGARLKWPNDALIDGRKVAGILTEAFPDEGFAVLGLGLNASFQEVEVPQDLAEVLTDLETHLDPGSAVDEAVARVFSTVLVAYRKALPELLVEPERASRLLWTTEELEVGGVRGRVAGIAPTGELRLVTKDGQEVAVSMGEVRDARGD